MLRFWPTKNSGSQVGVDFRPTGVAVAEVSTLGKSTGQIKHCDFLPAVGVNEQADVLKAWVEQHKLIDSPCNTLIAKHDVQLFQLEKPSVEEQELMQAVSWKIKDLVNFDVETAVVDIFQLPESPKSPVSYINAVVANETVVASYVERIKHAGLDLKVIDVHDLVSKNYRYVYEYSDQTLALLQFSDKEGLITIYHDNDLYVARDFKIGLLDINDALNEDESLYENLLLELQRSMDYFESTYAMGMIQKMMVFPQSKATERMVNYLQNYVGYDIDFARVDIERQGQAEQINAHCFAAYCAALRGVH